MASGPPYIASVWTAQKTPLPTVTPLLHVTQSLSSSGYLFGSTILALSKYGTICCLEVCSVLCKLNNNFSLDMEGTDNIIYV
jgi:hypothetical protein